MWEYLFEFFIALGICLIVALAIVVIVSLIGKLVRKRAQWPDDLITFAQTPFRVLVILLAVWLATAATFPFPEDDNSGWRHAFNQLMTIAVIGVGAWLTASLVRFGTEQMLGRYRTDVADNRAARRIRTQVLILRRLAIAIIVVIAVGSALLTFDAVRAVGASVLASAGIASIVAGLAAQSTLGNLFAGIQIVFTDALRVDDVVVVEGEWGRVGEVTLTYIVVDVWDERRLVLPCTYFTTQPFENWTRKGSEILGTVELDVDWRVPLDRLRERLRDVLDDNPLWDGRTGVIQATDATGGLVRARVLVSAEDSGKLWDLRCLVREELISYMQRSIPQALPTQRVLVGDQAEQADEDVSHAPSEGMFSGSADAEERHRQFTQPNPVIEDAASASVEVVDDPTS